MTNISKNLLLASTALLSIVAAHVPAFAADGITVTTSQTLSGSYTGGAGANGTAGNDGGQGDDGAQYGGGNAGTIAIQNNATLTGGQGGIGGQGVLSGENGFQGGQGGAGVNIPVDGTSGFPGNNPGLINNSGGVIRGGKGGDGGDSEGSPGPNGDNFDGVGGVGGDGLHVDGNFATISNAGQIIGGAGGDSLQNDGSGGYGGIGINVVASDVEITNDSTGVIRGGAGGLSPYNNETYPVGDGISVSGSIGTLSNSGAIRGLSLVDNSQALANAISVNNGGAIAAIKNYAGTIQSDFGNAIAVYNGGAITMVDNRGGAITSATGNAIYNAGTISSIINGSTLNSTGASGYAIYNAAGGTIGGITNNGFTISANGGTAIANLGTMSLDNTNGTISSVGGSALQLNTALTGNLVNTNGVVTSASAASPTVAITGNLGSNTTIVGGTVRNTNASGTAFAFTANQSNTINLQGAQVISDGGTPNSGNGVAFSGQGNNFAVNANAGSTVRGAINQTGTGNTNLTTAGTLVGNINLANGNDTITVNGGSITGNIAFGGGTNALNVNSTLTTGGTIAASGGSSWGLNVGSAGNFTADRALNLGSAGAATIASGGRLYVSGGNFTTGGALNNQGTVQIGVGRILTAGSFNAGSAGTLRYDVAGVSNAVSTGSLNTGASAANLTNQTVAVNYTGGAFSGVSRSLIATGTGAATLPSAALVNPYLYNFSLERDTTNTNQVYLVLQQAVTLANAATTDNNAAASNVLLGELASSSDPVITQIRSNLNGAATQQQYNEILEATLPTVDSGNQVAAVGMAGAMFDLADGQLAMVETGSDSGVSSGNNLTGLHVWAQGFGGDSSQGLRSGVDGYDADVTGVAVGADTRNLRSDTIVGLSFGYADTDVDSRNSNRTHTDIDSYQVMVYANHDLKQDNFLTGMAVAGYNRNDQRRSNVGGIAGLTASSDYDSWTGGLRASAGHNFHLVDQFTNAQAVRVTPQLFSEFVHFTRDGYSETGAGGANLTAGDADQDILNLGTSLQAEWAYDIAGGILKPDVHTSLKYDVIDDKADTTAAFAAGGSTFDVGALDPANTTASIGTGVKFYMVGGWDFTANYDYTFKADYSSHSGYLRAAYQF